MSSAVCIISTLHSLLSDGGSSYVEPPLKKSEVQYFQYHMSSAVSIKTSQCAQIRRIKPSASA